ncbi:MAG: hypothetical protein JW742_04325 [Candidatus Aminicenantes bacterium]|nr:hypothetical protein [Candidatus Aminicenantes bacterium]
MNSKRIIVGCVVLITAALVVAPLQAQQGPKPKKGPAKVAWDEPFAKTALPPGGTAVLNAVFAPTKDLADISFFLTPSIKNVLTVAPASLAAAPAGMPVPVVLTVVFPAAPECMNFNGNLWVTAKGKKVGKPLHLRFKVLKSE